MIATSTTRSTPSGAISRIAARRVAARVVDDVVGTRRRREPPLLVAAHGRDDGGPGPAGELDRGVADGTGTAGDQHDAALERSRSEPVGTVLVDGEAAVGGHGRYAERRADVVRRGVGQAHHAFGRHHGVLGGSADRPVVLGEEDPDPVTGREAGDAVAHLVDDPGAVLAGHDLVEGQRRRGGAGPGLPVGGVHARDREPDPHLAPVRRGQITFDELQDGGVTELRVHDSAHGPDAINVIRGGRLRDRDV